MPQLSSIKEPRIYNDKEPIYEKQKWETTKAYNNFCKYRDYGPERTISLVFGRGSIKKTKIKLYKMEQFCWIHEWVKRCTAYDTSIEKKLREHNEKEIIKRRKLEASMGKRLISYSNKVLKMYEEQLKDVRRRKRKQNLTIDDALMQLGISPFELQRMLKNGNTHLRQGMGESLEVKDAEQEKVDTGKAVEKLQHVEMSKEEKVTMAKLQGKLKEQKNGT